MTPVRPASFAALLLLLAFAGTARAELVVGSGRAVTQQRPLAGVEGVAIAIPAHVEIVQDGTERLVLTTDDNVAPAIETEVRDGVLEVRARRDAELRPTLMPRILLHVRGLSSLAMAGMVDARIPLLQTPRLELRISGPGDVQLGAIMARELTAQMSGTAKVRASGNVEALDVRMSGMGDFGAPRLESRRTKLAISGASHVTTWTREDLDVTISGMGEVRYYGDPAVQKRIAGGGSVRRIGPTPS